MDVYVLTKNKMDLQDSKTRCVLKRSTDIISMIVDLVFYRHVSIVFLPD
jgi:hypothetical protein